MFFLCSLFVNALLSYISVFDIYTERPVYSKELVLPLVMSWGRENMLIIKQNYVAEMAAPYVSISFFCVVTLFTKVYILLYEDSFGQQLPVTLLNIYFR